MNITIAPASKKDVSGILNVFNELYIRNNCKAKKSEKELCLEGFLVYPITKKDLEEVIKNKDDFLLVAKDKEKVIGYLLAYDLKEWMKLKPDWKDSLKITQKYKEEILSNKTIYYRQVGRLSGYKGIGLRLEKEMLEKIKERRYTKIVCEIAKSPKNITSEKVHTSLGYKEIGEIKYGDGIIWGVYIKKL